MPQFSPPEIWEISRIVGLFIAKVNRNRDYEDRWGQVLEQTYSARMQLTEWRKTGPSFSVEVSRAHMQQFELILDAFLGPNNPPGSVSKAFKFIGVLEKDGTEIYEIRNKLARRDF